jgi:hypothetical protein
MTDSVKHLHTSDCLKHVENIADTKSHPQQSLLPQMETHPGAGAALTDYIAEPGEHDALGYDLANLQNNPYYPFATCEE